MHSNVGFYVNPNYYPHFSRVVCPTGERWCPNWDDRPKSSAGVLYVIHSHTSESWRDTHDLPVPGPNKQRTPVTPKREMGLQIDDEAQLCCGHFEGCAALSLFGCSTFKFEGPVECAHRCHLLVANKEASKYEPDSLRTPSGRGERIKCLARSRGQRSDGLFLRPAIIRSSRTTSLENG